MAQYYNKKVHGRVFWEGDLLLRKVQPYTEEPGTKNLGPNWEGMSSDSMKRSVSVGGFGRK